jgi:hypothetical protein
VFQQAIRMTGIYWRLLSHEAFRVLRIVLEGDRLL